MAAVKCPGCGAYISVRGVVACPKCQAPVEPISDMRLSDTRKEPPKIFNSTKTKSGQGSPIVPIIGGVCILGIIISFGLIGWSLANPSAEKLRKRSISAALVQCQYAIKSTAAYGGADLPPFSKNYASDGDEFYFAWPRGSFEFSNGFGGRQLMSASCTGVLSTGTITHLTVNAKDIVNIPH